MKNLSEIPVYYPFSFDERIEPIAIGHGKRNFWEVVMKIPNTFIPPVTFTIETCGGWRSKPAALANIEKYLNLGLEIACVRLATFRKPLISTESNRARCAKFARAKKDGLAIKSGNARPVKLYLWQKYVS
jgi:hypothetical protein